MRRLPLTLIAFVLLPGCSSSDWLFGRWAQLSEDGKLVSCVEFNRTGTYATYLERNCEGAPEELLGGKFSLAKTRLVVTQRNRMATPSALVLTRRGPNEFVAAGASGAAGEYYRVQGPESVTALEQRLLGEGKIKVRELPAENGCAALGKSIDELSKLPKDDAPRLLKKSDAQLKLHAERPPAGGDAAKITYAADADKVQWIAWELAEPAFAPAPLGPRLEAKIGAPAKKITIGDGPEAQQITGWKAFCRNVRGQPTVEVDLTLFMTPAQKKGTVYVSEGSVGKLWATFEEIAKGK
ncbi:MAG TPA: hypothetical protein VGQ83_10705 [Polyangia bacterium]|jgi:hypothetical protein